MNSEHPLLNIKEWKLSEKINKSKLRDKFYENLRNHFQVHGLMMVA